MSEKETGVTKSKVSNTLKDLDNSMTQSDLTKAIELSKQIDVSDVNTVINFGVDTQRSLSDSTTKLLNKVKTSKAGEAGQALGELVMHVNAYDIHKSGFEKLLTSFGLGKLVNHTKKIVTAHESVEGNLVEVQGKLEDSRMILIGENANIENLYQEQVSYLRENKLNIEAIKIKQREIQKELLPALDKKIKETENDIDKNILIQDKNELSNFFISLDKKQSNLAFVNTSTFQSLPRLELIKSGNVELISKIQDTVLNVLPIWRGQIVEALQLQKQRELSDTMKGVSDLTNRLILNNADNTKENMLQIAKESERSVIDIETLKIANTKFVETIKGVIEIKNQGAKNRANAAETLKQIEADLRRNVDDIQKNIIDATDLSVQNTSLDEVTFEVVDDAGKGIKVEPMFSEAEVEVETGA